MSAINLEPAQGAPDASRIIHEGAYYVLPKCAGFDTFYPDVREAFFLGVRKIVGREAEGAVRRDGLGKLHLHVPTERVLLLEGFVESHLRRALYKWSYEVGARDLQLPHPFYVDHLIVIRIHFPYETARKARHAHKPGRPITDVRDHAGSVLQDPRILLNQVSRMIRRPRQNSAYAPDTFHGELTKPARSHGAHIDTWYGHSFDGINLWWSIEGVNALNSVILYPEMIARPMSYDPRNMYLAPGTPVSEPRTIDLKPGELLLFNPEMLHSTHVNISDETRVALTTRINPGRPRFNDEAPFNFEHWHVSSDLKKDRYASMKVFPASKHRGEPTMATKETFKNPNTARKSLVSEVSEKPIVVCAAHELPMGAKLAVDLPNAKLVLWRTKDNEVKAWSRLCPHVGVDLVDGWHDETAVYCPGHGLKFDWRTGGSACASLRLLAFHAEEKDGQIFLRTAAKAPVAQFEQ